MKNGVRCGLLAAGLLFVLLAAAWCMPDVQNAILYPINETGELEYNVTSAAAFADDVTVHGCGINDLADLAEVLGEADAPRRTFGTETGERTLGKAVTADLFFNENGAITVVSVTSVSERPVIGISWKEKRVSNLYRRFAETLERNGAYAVFLPLIDSEEKAETVLSQIDGLFMTGGEDVTPSFYGQEPQVHGAADCNPMRDESDLRLAQAAIRMDVPLLGVCRGAQILNVALGGGLIQDVPAYLGQRVLDGTVAKECVTAVLSGTLPQESETMADCGCETPHLRVEMNGITHGQEASYHPISKIVPDSKWLIRIFPEARVDWVASIHHQAIDPNNLGEGLTIAAYAADGTVEAVEYRANRFALGLQWHPERDALSDRGDFDVDQADSNAVLRTFVVHAGENRDETKTGIE